MGFPPHRLFDVTVPTAMRSATARCQLPSLSTANGGLTRYSIIHERSEEREAVVERTARVLATSGLKSNAGIEASGPCADIRSNDVVEQDSQPLGRCRSSAVECCIAGLGDISGAWRDGGREVRCVRSPVVDEDVFKERGLEVWVVEGCFDGPSSEYAGQKSEEEGHHEQKNNFVRTEKVLIVERSTSRTCSSTVIYILLFSPSSLPHVESPASPDSAIVSSLTCTQYRNLLPSMCRALSIFDTLKCVRRCT